MVALPAQEQSEQTTDNEAQALADIVEWSENQPNWIRDALRQLCHKRELSQEEIDELTEICIDENRIFNPIGADDIRDPNAATDKVEIKRVHSAEHVNALAPNQSLGFQKNGLTVVYGDNGSGKSGYARILKTVCRARDDEKILPNVYEQDTGTPTAAIDFIVNGQNVTTTWEQGEAPDPELSSVSVFDSKTANVHVEESNEVAYTPFPLELLQNLGQYGQAITAQVKDRIDAIVAQTPSTISSPDITADTAVGKLVHSLSAKTDPKTVETFATLSEEETNRKRSLEEDLNNDPNKAAAKAESQKNRIERALEDINQAVSVVNPETIQKLRDLYMDCCTKEEAAKLAAKQAFEDNPLSGVESSAWQALWNAAREYSENHAYPGQDFPVVEADDPKCVLCQQSLDEDGAAERLNNFENFVKDTTRREADKARAEYHQARQVLEMADISSERIREIDALFRDEAGQQDIADQVWEVLLVAKWNRYRILQRVESGAFTPPVRIAWVADAVDGVIARLEKRIAALRAPDQAQSRQKLQQEYNELKDRAWLGIVKKDIMSQIDRYQQIDSLKKAKTRANTSRISTFSTQLSKKLITEALRGQFAKEVDNLEVAHLAVELKEDGSRYGVPYFRVVLIHVPAEKIGEVLSEGEHRCIALAAFLAELATARSSSTIVFDDPVSSLDHIHREAIAKRLAKEAQKRQILVFTHDVVFLFMLDKECRKLGQPPLVRSVVRSDERTGFCNDNPPLKAQSAREQVRILRTQLTNKQVHYDNGNLAEWEVSVSYFQDNLRKALDKAVEESLAGVVERLSDRVESKNLFKLTVIDENDCKIMREGYGRISTLLHTAPGASNPALPSPKKILAEINVIETWINDIEQRQKQV